MAKMKAVQVGKAGGDFQLIEKEIPEPEQGWVRIKVDACGICHSDAFVKDGTFPGLSYPRIPGHEIAGTIDKTGDGVSQWKKGDRVGVGWHGGHCFECEACRNGDFINCENARITGVSFDGGYAEYMVAPQEAVARMPDGLKSVDAAPLLCAGITTYNALRNSGATAGDVVAVQGIGGLGHLAVQYARLMGFRTVALSRGKKKKELAHKLGAHVFIDTEQDDPVEKLQKLGGADIILATAPSGQAINSVIGGLGRDGNLIIVAAPMDSIEIGAFQLIAGRKSISGWPSGHAKESEETLRFSALKEILPKIETFPLEKTAEAYDRMITNQARFRVVLTMN